jgi:hypothetical protein
MKNQILLIGIFLSFGWTYSQNTFPTGANTAVGIGTGTTAVSGSGGLRLKVTTGVANTSGVQLTNLTSASPTTSGLLGKALSVNSSGNLVLVPVSNTTTNLFNSDGVLLGNRTIGMSSNNLIFNPSAVNSQFFINGINGNVGIGNVSPSSKLDVNGFVKSKGFLATNTSNSSSFFSNSLEYFNNSCVLGVGYEMVDTFLQGANRRMLNFYDLHSWNDEISLNDDMFLLNIIDRGNKERFSFYGNKAGGGQNGKTGLMISDKNQAEFFKLMDDGNNKISLQMGKPDSKFIIGGYSDYLPGLPHKLVVQNGSALIEGNILTNSNIGIGTSSFSDSTDIYRLSVKGAIRAERVKVYTTWADFVFDKSYDLPSLTDVEKHIKENGHLKDIPSAKDVEMNGIELGEMNKKLLQKIEELTLYIIEINKEVKDLKSKLK